MNIKKYVFQKAARNHIPISGTFELTPRCNLYCEMCHIRMSAEEQASCGAELTAAEWLSLGEEAVNAGMVYLLLTGGEPLLRSDFEQIYSGLAEMGILLTLNTNGTLVDERIVQCMEKNPPEKVNITLYGCSDNTYQKVCGSAKGYKAAIHGVELLKKAEIPVCINTTFTRHNASDMGNITLFAKENGIPIRMTSYLFPPLRCDREADDSCFLPPEEYGKLGAVFDSITMDSAQKKRRTDVIARVRECTSVLSPDGKAASCMAGRGAFWITWNGQVLPCGMLPKLGRSLKTESFANIWANLGHVMDGQILPVKCSGCSKRILCPVCAAVTQSGKEAPEVLCRYCDSYMEAISEMQKVSQW